MRRIICSSVDFKTLPYFPNYFIKCTIFGNEFIEHKMRVLILSANFIWNILIPKDISEKQSEIHVVLHLKYPSFLSDFKETGILWQILEKESSIKFHVSPFSGSRVAPDGRTDMTKLTLAYRNVAKAPNHHENSFESWYSVTSPTWKPRNDQYCWNCILKCGLKSKTGWQKNF